MYIFQFYVNSFTQNVFFNMLFHQTWHSSMFIRVVLVHFHCCSFHPMNLLLITSSVLWFMAVHFHLFFFVIIFQASVWASYLAFKFHLVGFGPSFYLDIFLNSDSIILAVNLVRTHGLLVNLRSNLASYFWTLK